MNRETFIEKLTEVHQTVEQLLATYRAASRTNLRLTLPVAQGIPARLVCQPAGKGGKQIERCVISTFQVAESLGFKGEFRHWAKT